MRSLVSISHVNVNVGCLKVRFYGGLRVLKETLWGSKETLWGSKETLWGSKKRHFGGQKRHLTNNVFYAIIKTLKIKCLIQTQYKKGVYYE